MPWAYQHELTDDPTLAARDEAIRAARTDAPTAVLPQPVVAAEAKNPLRPKRLADMIGQDSMRSLLRRMIDAAIMQGEPLDHVLLVGPAGMGKTTIATVIAHELAVDWYQVEAPVSHETLLSLRQVMQPRDILFIDEVHQQAVMERRGRTSNTQPEVLLAVLEDFTLPSGQGVLTFPHITVIGATTDEGMLPDPFIDRFPIRPHFEPYTVDELATMATTNAHALGLQISPDAADRFALASRGVPRVVNNYVRNAHRLTGSAVILESLAQEVVETLNGVTEDGLTRDMQNVLTFLYERGMHVKGNGEVVYSAALSTLATAIGKSRDSRAIQLRVEPYLIGRGLIQVGAGGRRLTDAGVTRARELLGL